MDITKENAISQISESIAYCGLVCSLCHVAGSCDGCRSENNCCGNHTSASGCYQYNCCTEKGIAGCWECEQGPCDEAMFGEGHDLRLRAFIRFIKLYGKDKLAECIYENMKQGIHYGHGKDYDQLPDEAAVFAKLLNQ